jgi:hypothetical protein
MVLLAAAPGELHGTWTGHCDRVAKTDNSRSEDGSSPAAQAATGCFFALNASSRITGHLAPPLETGPISSHRQLQRIIYQGLATAPLHRVGLSPKAAVVTVNATFHGGGSEGRA